MLQLQRRGIKLQQGSGLKAFCKGQYETNATAITDFN
jgi:hypothetical protein